MGASRPGLPFESFQVLLLVPLVVSAPDTGIYPVCIQGSTSSCAVQGHLHPGLLQAELRWSLVHRDLMVQVAAVSTFGLPQTPCCNWTPS